MPRTPAPWFVIAVAAVLATLGPAAAGARLAPGQPLDRGVLEQLLAGPLTGGDGEESASIRIDEPDLPLVNRASQPIDLSVTSLRRDEGTGRYTAQLAATLPDGTSSRILVSGAVEQVTDVPVLGRPVAAGEVIQPGDIVWKKMVLPRRQTDALLEADAIVGLEARRPLPADRALRARDVRAQLLVQRGEPVSVLYRAGGLEITAAGSALETGRLGEVVEVRNPSSGEVRRGVVEARQRVRVSGLAVQP